MYKTLKNRDKANKSVVQQKQFFPSNARQKSKHFGSNEDFKKRDRQLWNKVFYVYCMTPPAHTPQTHWHMHVQRQPKDKRLNNEVAFAPSLPLTQSQLKGEKVFFFNYVHATQAGVYFLPVNKHEWHVKAVSTFFGKNVSMNAHLFNTLSQADCPHNTQFYCF